MLQMVDLILLGKYWMDTTDASLHMAKLDLVKLIQCKKESEFPKTLSAAHEYAKNYFPACVRSGDVSSSTVFVVDKTDPVGSDSVVSTEYLLPRNLNVILAVDFTMVYVGVPQKKISPTLQYDIEIDDEDGGMTIYMRTVSMTTMSLRD